jgi:hypothetical protein
LNPRHSITDAARPRSGDRPLLLLSAKGASVFTVGDADGFAESGGVAQPIVENDRMRFAINTASAQRGRLNINSRLLSLAKIAKDNRNVRIP